MNQMTTCRWSFLEDVTAYVDAGIESIGVWRPKLVEFGEERAAELLGEAGLSVASLSYAGGFTVAHGHSWADSLDDAFEALEQAACLQAGCLVVMTGNQGGFTLSHARRIVREALRKLGDEAADLGIQIALQPVHPRFARDTTFLTTLNETVEFLNYTGHPQVGMAFDIYQLCQEPHLTSRISDVLPLIKIVQLADWRAQTRSDQDRCLLGKGTIPLGDILAGLEQAGYQGAYDVQILSDEVWKSNYGDVLEHCQTWFQALATECLS